MKHMFISDAHAHVEKEITVKGWLSNKRSSGKIAFLELRDGSGFIQAVVVKSAVSEETWGSVDALTQESSLAITGTVSAHPKKEDVFELQVVSIDI
ncbi:MAG: asparagine--tRNA ligase, partial [Candidatus Magasanikbacteria bacterium]|nr:asparagine--tRNA ligase [Candidatus Magasanikbacteria bacterium]